MTIVIPIWLFWVLGVVVGIPVLFFSYIGFLMFWHWNK